MSDDLSAQFPLAIDAERAREILRLVKEGKVRVAPAIRDGIIYEASLVPYSPGDERHGVHPFVCEE